ncbi:MAG: shikimate kinase [Muribaculaceae bacterium]|nr:shikimate kinase [Muribaculaceae bacterium]
MFPIFIVGYMASGKTTFGRALGRALGREFIDLDFYIEQRFRKSIKEIFSVEGEEAFRRKESAMLKEAGEFENTVISCGGGTPCFFDNMEYMNSRGVTVFLNTDRECIVRRLLENNSRRPLMAGKSEEEIRAEMDRTLEKRLPFYSAAKIHFSGNMLENKAQIASSVEDFIRNFISLSDIEVKTSK